MDLTWDPWTNVSEGSTAPGAPVAAVPWGDSFALFLADPGGGIYAIKATPGFGWEAVPGLKSTPGAHVTALASQDGFRLFVADVHGEVYTTSGTPYQGWHPWTNVSEGSTAPGAPVAAVPWGDSFALFLADPGGGIYAIKATPGFGWEAVPGLKSTPGAHVTALVDWWFRLFVADVHGEVYTTSGPSSTGSQEVNPERFLLFVVNVNGEICATSGTPYQGWHPWTSMSEVSMPGAPVTAVPENVIF
jgi:hypothetical protein